MKKVFLTLCLLGVIGAANGQNSAKEDKEYLVTFRFIPGNDIFYTPLEGNDGELIKLYGLIDHYRTKITSGEIPVYVDGYSPTKNLSFIRANRVKSELILYKGLTEDNFITKNHTTTYTAPDGTTYKNLVVVTLRIPAPKPEPVSKPEPKPQTTPEPEPEPVKEEPTAQDEPSPEPVQVASWWHSEPYRIAVRTNLLYDGFGLPTIGLEYRVNRYMGIKLDGSRSWWGGGDNGKVQKIWLLSPEVRWYLLENRRFYVGASANFGEYNIYKYPVGGLFSSDTGYQGKLWGAGATVGYQLYLNKCLSLDFNLGLGYTHSQYDSFTIIRDTRVYKERDKTKTAFGPTQAGVNLVWTLGGNR